MRSLRFRLLALFAAYAIALHAPLLAFAVPSGTLAGPHFGATCSGLPADDSGAPPNHHDTSCAFFCAALGAKLAAEAPAAMPVMPLVAGIRFPALEAAPPVAIPAGTPRARAPPMA
jgi:hypothetical protein